MGTTAEKLTYLNDTKMAIREAINGKGVLLESNIPFSGYPSKIKEIETTWNYSDRFPNLDVKTILDNDITEGFDRFQKAIFIFRSIDGETDQVSFTLINPTNYSSTNNCGIHAIKFSDGTFYDGRTLSLGSTSSIIHTRNLSTDVADMVNGGKLYWAILYSPECVKANVGNFNSDPLFTWSNAVYITGQPVYFFIPRMGMQTSGLGVGGNTHGLIFRTSTQNFLLESFDIEEGDIRYGNARTNSMRINYCFMNMYSLVRIPDNIHIPYTIHGVSCFTMIPLVSSIPDTLFISALESGYTSMGIQATFTGCYCIRKLPACAFTVPITTGSGTSIFNLTKLDTITLDMSSCTTARVFGNMSCLTDAKLILYSDSLSANATLTLSTSPLLTTESLHYIAVNAPTLLVRVHTLVLGAALAGKMGLDDIAILTGKGWTVTL